MFVLIVMLGMLKKAPWDALLKPLPAREPDLNPEFIDEM